MIYLYAVNIAPKQEEGKPVTNRIVHVVGESIPMVLDKVNAAYPGCDIKQVTKMQSIEIP